MEKFVIASDHAAFEMKQELKKYLENFGHEIVDLGCDSLDSVHYPDYAKDLSEYVLEHKIRGILLCGSGIGMSIAANRYKGIHATLVNSVELAEMSRKHNHSNVLVLGARFIDLELAKSITDTWILTEPLPERHQMRVAMIDN